MTEAEAQSGELSKSARKRANQKAAAAAAKEAEEKAKAEAEAAAKAAAAKPKAKGKAKAEPKAEPKAAAKAEAKAKPAAKSAAKAEAKAEPKAAPKAEAKAKAAGKAAAKAKAEPTPPPPEPAPAAKPAAKPASKAKAKAKSAGAAPAPAPEAPKEDRDVFLQYDDGSGGDWEVSTGMTKKQQKQQDKKKEVDAMIKAAAAAGQGVGQKRVPGMAPEPAPTKGASQSVSQSVANTGKEVAIANAAATVAAKEEAGKTEPANSGMDTVQVKVPEAKIGRVIGPKGANINLIKEKTGIARIDTTGELVTITGPKEAVAMAENAINELIEKGYMALSYDDFTESSVNVHPSAFPDLIGKKGAVIREIKEKVGVEISIPADIPKEPSKSGKKYKVSIAGGKSAVEKAKEVINDILMYYHHEITHPGEVHEEFELPGWAYAYVIGKGGCEMRHIQKNFMVRMYLPRDHSPNQNCVIVGDSVNVERAKVYVDKLVYNVENQSNKRDKADDGDVWGDEQHESWMDQYMYKRN
eukprot:CAMPEP_0178399146 /NCGR_PEP_ID=MMETSP0689_2-20121128/15132_1 /TAXON_ID=160604 /ORGANISM="Amphidinium massartii, Strain CS-259" /LENGTH=524 /DNA_ID=CAMNT_0020019919 /DNA_START=60 /DNA_END=1634 /DNA_ORIENTATION=-